MTIQYFAFQNQDTGWTLEETAFEALNLLVGISGVGKTKILKALSEVQGAAISGARYITNCSWKLGLEVAGDNYEWTAQSAVTRFVYPSRMLPPSGEKIATDARFVKEAIRRNGELFAQRNNKLNLRGQEITGLDESESVIKLFKSDEYVKPLYASLRNMLFMDLPTGGVPLSFSVEAAENIRKQLTTLTELQDSDWPIMVRGYVLQENHRDMFDRIKQDYMDIFPTVLDLRVGQYRDLGYKPFLDERFQDNLTFGIREEGVEGWVASEDISAGMMKVLVYLIELGLAPQGTVVLIDELENSLGINCLPDLAQRMLKDLDRLQFIATSHHPRVINEIPYRRWRLVTRNGPIVKVLDATSIPALETASSLEKFTQLINLREYEEGVA